MFIRALLGSLLSVVAIVGPVSAATSAASTLVAQTGSSTLTGTVVTESGAGIPQAVVTIEGAGQRVTATTDVHGAFSAAVPAGIYTLTVNKGGFQTGSTQTTVTGGSTVSVSVTLTAASLNNLNVIGRTATNIGNAAKFNISSSTINTISDAQLQARNTPSLVDVVSTLPGITIPRAASGPAQDFVIRGLRYETTVTLDGHPVSSGTGGFFYTNYASAGIFGGVDVFKGGGLNGPISGESGVGIVNVRSKDFTAKDSGYFQAGLDNYGGSFYDVVADVNLGKFSILAGKSFTGYRGPTYGLQENDIVGATNTPGFPFGTYAPVQNITSGVIGYIQDFSDTYSLSGELAKLRYKFSDATSLSIGFLGLEGRYDPQGGAYGQFVGYATVPQCVNGKVAGNGAACTIYSQYNAPNAQGLIGQSGVPSYVFYPGSNVRQNQPNWTADFKTTIGNDTLLFRPYTAAINRLTDGSLENTIPGDSSGAWYEVTNPADCQVVSSAPNAATHAPAFGPCYQGGVTPGVAYINPASPAYPALFPYQTTNGTCSVATPCYTTPTAANNQGQYGFGAPYTTLELDKLFGYTFSYIHDTLTYVNDASPLAAGCTFTFGYTGNTLANAGPLGYQPNCKDADGNVQVLTRASPLSVPETFASKTSLAVTAQIAATSQLEVDLGAYYTHYVINGAQQNPATLEPTYIAANYAGNSNAVPIDLVATQNGGSHVDPRFGLLFRPSKNLAVRFSAGSALTIPYASLVSGFKKYSLGVSTSTISTPNYGLLPEETVQEDLGFDFRYTKRGGVFSWDIYNADVHNPWLSTSIPFCSSVASLGLRPCTLTDFAETTTTGYTSQTLNGAQEFAQGVEFTFNDEPRYGFGYRTNLSFERAYYMGTPAVYFGNSPQLFWNGAQLVTNGSQTGPDSVPYAKAYAEVQYATRGFSLRFGSDYEGNNNTYNVPAFFLFDTGVKINTGFHNVFVNVTGENIFNNLNNAALGRGVEYQGQAQIAATPVTNGYKYSSPFNSAAINPGPETWRFSIVKQF
jgi:hypothetical protein